MEAYEIGWLIVYVIFCILALFVILKLTNRGQHRPLRKAPSRYVHIASTDELKFSKEIYNLDWKPAQDRPAQYPERIEKLLSETDKISPLIMELSSALNSPEINPKEISQLIITDQGLTSFILKRVNSPYYGLVQKIDNIFNAIVILGYNEIYRLVMEERIKKIGIQPSRGEWIHANMTSTMAAYLATSSGMLHNMGRNLMLQSLTQPGDEAPDDPRACIRWENEQFGIDHASLGGELARRWGMPERLCSCIEKYHWPQFWSLRDVAQKVPEIIKEISILSIADIASRHFRQQLMGPYIGDDYYFFIKKSPRMETIIAPEVRKDLERIKRLGQDQESEKPQPMSL